MTTPPNGTAESWQRVWQYTVHDSFSRSLSVALVPQFQAQIWRERERSGREREREREKRERREGGEGGTDGMSASVHMRRRIHA